MARRTLKAVLVGVDNSQWAPDEPLVDAVPRIHDMAQYLANRFVDNQIEVLTSDADAPVTKQMVLGALHRLQIQQSDLVMVVFFGHGIPEFEDHPNQAWALSGLEELTDSELFEFITRSGSSENVVVSACCFARGFFEPGRRRLTEHTPMNATLAVDDARLGAVLDRFARNFKPKVQVTAPRPFLLISGAGVGGDDGALLQFWAPKLLELVQAAATRRQRYMNLWFTFRSMRAAGRSFYLDSRPPQNLLRRVLKT